MIAYRTLVCCGAVLASTVVLLGAQGRGARPGGPGGARGGGPGGGASTIERIVVHGKSLEGNLEGDSPDREVTVYLPPSYAGDRNRRYPVLYLLHGFDERDDAFTTRAGLKETADRLDATQGFSSAIIVTPNAFTLHRGSMYSSSPTIGDWERFIADDLVASIDGRYRTLATRTSRGLAGYSMGGYGALRIAMKRSDVFMSLYIMSACCLTAPRDYTAGPMTAAEAITTRAQAEAAARAPAFGPSLNLASAAAWSANAKNPPLFLDLPVQGGKVRPDVAEKWAANASVETVGRYVDALNAYYAIAIDVAAKDPQIGSHRQMHDAMARLRIAHHYEEYDGEPANRVRERLERYVLPFFSKNLVAPANPTSPLPQK